MKITQPCLVVLLRRSENEKTPLTVMPHEVEVLKALHGEDSVSETEDTPPVKSVEFDPEEEYARLEGLYIGNDRVSNPVREGVGTLDEFVSSFDGYKAAKANKTTVTKQTNSEDAEKDELVEKAKVLGIKSPHLFGVDKLKEKIEEAEAEKIKALVEKAESLNIEVQGDWDIATLEAEIAKVEV
jgi:hypothetical protein